MQTAQQVTPGNKSPTAAPPVSEVTPSAKPKTKSSQGRCLLIGCVGLLCAFLTACAVVAGLVGFTFNLVSQSASQVSTPLNRVCDANVNELRNVYQQSFTSSYRERVSFNEFRKFYLDNADIFSDCRNKFTSLSFNDFLNSQLSININNDRADISALLRGKQIYLYLARVGDDWLINDLAVK